MEVVKERVNASKRVLEKTIKCSCESNVIVPDRNPDILKILHVDATCSIVKKTVSNGRLSVEGKIFADVIYLPDSENCNIKTLPAVFEFNDIIDCPEIDEGMYSRLSCEIEQLDINLINSRKITLRAVVCIDTEITADREIEYISSVNAEDTAYKCEDVNLYRMLANDECEFLIKEQIDLVRGEATELLKCDVAITDKEVRLAGSKVIVKGAACATLLYCGEDNSIENINARFPFTEVFEVGEITDSDFIDANLCVIEKECKKGIDSNGNSSFINIELLIRAEITVRRDERICCLCDCYCFGAETECDVCDIEAERIVTLPGAVKSIREVISTDKHMPQISTVYNVVAKPRITSTEKNGNLVTANGVLEVSVLYLSESSENPICCHKAEIPIIHTFEITSPGELAITAECEHISYTLTGNSDVEVRAAVNFDVTNRKSDKVKMISGIEKKQTICSNELIIFFAKGGEELWEIAKEYKVDPSLVAELNAIDESSPIERGKRLIIPRM